MTWCFKVTFLCTFFIQTVCFLFILKNYSPVTYSVSSVFIRFVLRYQMTYDVQDTINSTKVVPVTFVCMYRFQHREDTFDSVIMVIIVGFNVLNRYTNDWFHTCILVMSWCFYKVIIMWKLYLKYSLSDDQVRRYYEDYACVQYNIQYWFIIFNLTCVIFRFSFDTQSQHLVHLSNNITSMLR